MGKLSIGELGELGLIEVVRRRAGERGRGTVVGIGDDAAVLKPRSGQDWAATADALIEDVHFRWRTTDARSLGRKALAVNLSDLAAMGARPRGFLLSWGLPSDADPAALDGFLSGLLAESRATKCPLVGGDTVRAPRWMLSITAFGEVAAGAALKRDGAAIGDRVLVTGELGSAALGLLLLERGFAETPGAAPHVRRQVRPRARLLEGRRLRRLKGVTAAIDLSDGVARDLAHVTRASGVSARVDLERLPLARGLRRQCERLDLDPVELAFAGGEDYELLFCVRRDAPPADVLARSLGCAVTEIGVTERGRGVRAFRDGVRVSPRDASFEHFKRIPVSSDK